MRKASFHTPDLPSRSARHTPGGGVVVAGRPLSVLSGLAAARIGNLLATGGRRSLQERGALGGVRLPATPPSVYTVTDSHTPELPATAAWSEPTLLKRYPQVGIHNQIWDIPPKKPRRRRCDN